MFYALLRFIFIEMPCAFFKGLSFVLFEKKEIIDTAFFTRRRKIPLNKEKIVAEYLEKCRKQVYEKKDK